jgi:hypothetical protein
VTTKKPTKKQSRLEWVKPPKLREGETETNAQGGKHSFTLARYDAVPPVVLRLLAQCNGFGLRKYGLHNWKKIPLEEHIGHAMNHLVEWSAGDRSEPHLVNALTRVAFALTLAVEAGLQAPTYDHPEV